MKKGGKEIIKKYFLTTFFCLVSFLFFTNKTNADSTSIIINEIGAFEATNQEWMEIYNAGASSVDLTNWKFFENNANHGLTLFAGSDNILDTGEYAIIVQDATTFQSSYPLVTATIFDSSWGTLNESGELIGLKDSAGNFIEQFTYVSASDFSLERINATVDYTGTNWKEHPTGQTAGSINYWSTYVEPPTNTPPTAVINAPATGTTTENISFDGNSSSDSDGTISSYDWNFGDGNTGSGANTTYAFASANTHTITLTVTDNSNATSTAQHTITITESIETPPASNTSTLVINEFLPDPNEENEWIELYNATTNTIDLTGWTLSDGVGIIASPTSTISANAFFVIELSSSKLNNSGDILTLKQAENIIDTVAYGNWDDGNTSNNADEPAKGNTLVRIPDGYDTNTDDNDIKETTTPTKNSTNVLTAPVSAQTPPPSGGSSQASVTAPSFTKGDIIINELVSDPSDDEVEFVELYNPTNSNIDLTNWTIEDGSETKSQLTGTIAGKGFFTLESPKGQLNNSGDAIFLLDPTDKEIDHVTYGTWDDGNITDNALSASDPYSLARKQDGLDADNDMYDFVRTKTITKGKSNIITAVSAEEVTEAILSSVVSSTIVINEIYPNPPGSDNDEEFVELKNIGTQTISIVGWKLNDSSQGKGYILTQGSLIPGGLIIFKRTQTKIALNNTGGDEVKLFLPNGAIVARANYTGSVANGESYSRKPDGEYAWSNKMTPNAENIIAGKNSAPKIALDADTEVLVGEAVSFDASDTIDPEDKILTFHWDFGDDEEEDGDAVEHIYQKMGVYTVTLQVTDSQKNMVEKKVVVTVTDENAELSSADSNIPAGLIISEFFPNPKGSDNTEFIEMYNDSDEPIDLSGLKLDDEDGGSRPFVIDEGASIEAKTYKVFGKQETKLSLNNTDDSVRLLDEHNNIIFEISYDGVIEGASYSRDMDDNWNWVGTPTPGALNSKTIAREKSSTKKTSSKKIGPITDVTLDKIREEDVGDTVRVSGIVAVLPGIMGTQYFYIVGPIGGVQIYSYKKDFPKLTVGDSITVTGELGEISGETRLKTTIAKDMVVNGHDNMLNPAIIDIADVGESYEGWLVKIDGEVTEKKSSYLWVDDGTGEVKVYFKKGAEITGKDFVIGEKVTISGIISETRSGYQLLPRGIEDISHITPSKEITADTGGDSSQDVAETYLTATAGGLTSILIGLLAKARGAFALAFLKRITKSVALLIKIKKV